MTLPIGEIGASAISGGAVVAFAMKMLPILIRKINGNKKQKANNAKPGYSEVCIEQGKKLVKHSGEILSLQGSIDRVDNELELQHTENREDFNRMFDKIDRIKK